MASGELVCVRRLAQHWAVSPRAVSIAVREHELFAVVHRRRKYYPREVSLLDKAVVAQICRAMAGVPPWTQFIFWKRVHGALGGRTVAEVLLDPVERDARVVRVLALAKAWAASEAA